MADRNQQTEKPTPRRLIKAREEGNFPTARVFVSAVQFVAFVGLLHAWAASWIHMLRSGFIAVMQRDLNPRLNAMNMVYVGFALLKQLLIPVGFMGGLLIVVAIAIQLVVTGFGISIKKLTPDFQRAFGLYRDLLTRRD